LAAQDSAPKVLLVDDELDITLVLKRGLGLHGFRVNAYSEPARALAEYKPNYYDCIILDIRMPGMNGFELARKIWQIQPNAQVCFLTAFEIYEAEANKVFKDLRTKCFLKKPLTASALAQHMQMHQASP
jgi:CheY-like chemotaxis protein